MASKQTQACERIINAVESSVAGRHSHWQIFRENILDKAQELVNNDGYVFDVALSIACKMYPVTRHCGNYAYGVID